MKSTALLVLAALTLGGCATVALDRDKVAKLPGIDVQVVESPGIQVMTIMQAFAASPQAGAIPILIAESQDKVYVRPPSIPNLGELIAQGLRERMQGAGWPKMAAETKTIPRAEASREALRIDVLRYEVAPLPLRFVFAVVEASLRDAQGEPLWRQSKTFSGGLHGERIDLDKLQAGDASQLDVEVRRAAAYLVNEFLDSLQVGK